MDKKLVTRQLILPAAIGLLSAPTCSHPIEEADLQPSQQAAQRLTLPDGSSFYVPVVDLGAFGSDPQASAINNAGDVVGYGNFEKWGGMYPRAFRYSHTGELSQITPDDAPAYGFGINTDGVAVGGIAAGGQAFTVSPSNEMTMFPIGGTYPWAYFANAHSINDNNEITGYAFAPNSTTYNAFRYTTATGLVSLGSLPGPEIFDGNSQGLAIDNSGRVVGRAATVAAHPLGPWWYNGHAFLQASSAAVMQDLNDLATSKAGFDRLVAATALNDTVITGWGVLPDNFTIHGFRYHNDGTVDQLPELPRYGYYQSVAYGINIRGDIVGTAFGNQGGNNHAFIYTAEGNILDLNDFVDPTSEWTLQSAADINDSREIVGYGIHGMLGQRAFKIKLPDLSPCGTPVSTSRCSAADDGVVVSCFGLVNQTVLTPDGTTGQIATNIYFGGCTPDDPGMQIVERTTATADPLDVAAACDRDCNARLAGYAAAHRDVALPLSCQTIFVSTCDGLGADITPPSSSNGIFRGGGPADARISLSGTLTFVIGGASTVVPATGVADVTVGPCAPGATSCPVLVSRFDFEASESFVVNGSAIDQAQIQSQGLATGQVGPAQLSIPANAIEAEVSFLSSSGSPRPFHVRNDNAFVVPATSLDPTQLFSSLTMTMGGGAVQIAMQGIASGHPPASDLTPPEIISECECPTCTASGTFTSLATDVDQDLQSLAWRVDGVAQFADGTNAPPWLDVTFGLGTHEISLVATDSRGAESTASATFAVLDRVSPVVTPPPNITLQSCAFPDIGRATATDVCSLVEDIGISNDAPAAFQAGTTTVTWTAEDGSLNDALATQQVTMQPVADAVSCCPPGIPVRMVGANHVFTGTEEPECIIGTAGADTIDGGGGNDYIIGGGGQDTIHGGPGDDVIIGGDDRAFLFGDDGNDRIAGGLGPDQIHGGPGADTLIGGGGDDTINGDDGNDDIRGGAGQDDLSGDDGDDLIDGEAGDDTIAGGAGADRLIGGPGDDVIDGGPDSNVLIGLDGNDRLTGGTSNDRFFGGRGTNTCTNGGGSDAFALCGP